MTTAATNRQDEELTELLAKLYTIQEDLGAKPRTSDEDKKEKAKNVATTMGRGRKAEKKGSRFLELKSTIVDRLKSVHTLLKETKDKEKAGYGGDNAKDMIKMQAEIREHIRQATDEWQEMDGIYKNEARKKKSKFTLEELEVQAELVKRLHSEIEKVKEAQMRGYAKTRDPGTAVALNTKAIYSDPGNFNKSGNGSSWAASGSAGGGAALSDGQRQQLALIEERDADFDRQLDEIGEGITDLAEIAALQGEEVKRQSAMLDHVNSRMDDVQERLTSVNSKLKETLEQVGRSSDKLCVDIMCIVLAVGFGAVIYNMFKNG